MLQNEQAVPAKVSTSEPDLLAGGPIRYRFGSGPTNSWWGLLGWWGLFRDGRDPRLVAFGHSQAKGFGLIRDWVDAYVDARARHRLAPNGAVGSTGRGVEIVHESSEQGKETLMSKVMHEAT